MQVERKTILGVPVDALQPEEFLEAIEEGLQDTHTKTIFAVNAEKIMFARKDKELFKILDDSDVLIPDGFGPVVGLHLIHGVKLNRTTGIGLMERLLDLSANKNFRVFIYGARPDINRNAIDKIKEKYPALNLVGAQHGYHSEEEMEGLISKINSLNTDILFVGLGSPKQEKWIHRHKGSLKVRYCMGVGGSLDVFAGNVALAPVWISNLYLEWAYRLVKQPSRFKRQKVIPIFILKILKEALSSRFSNETD
jgi:N-acetylglucosaminyldiphosphoundecaprenol N-acetyl-beta-D-mannosaminyltransferase